MNSLVGFNDAFERNIKIFSHPHSTILALPLLNSIYTARKHSDLKRKMKEEEIKKLFLKYQQGRCSDQEKLLVEGFLNSFQADPKEIIGQEEIGQRIYAKIQEGIKEKEALVSSASGSRRSFFKYAAVVALLIVSTLAALFLWNDTAELNYITKTTQRGQKSNIILSDGTTIRLNSESTLIYPEKFTGDVREVQLIGEAFFDVRRNTNKPFIVRSGDLETTVLGTSFNINAFPDQDIAVTVVTGKVQVSPLLRGDAEGRGVKETSPDIKNQNDSPTGQTFGGEGVILTPNQQAVFEIDNKKLTRREVELKSHLAWKNGKIIFDRIRFEEAALILERWFNIEIEFDNEALRDCLIRSEYNNENLVNILESLKFIQGVDYKIQTNNQVLLSGEACKE